MNKPLYGYEKFPLSNKDNLSHPCPICNIQMTDPAIIVRYNSFVNHNYKHDEDITDKALAIFGYRIVCSIICAEMIILQNI